MLTSHYHVISIGEPASTTGRTQIERMHASEDRIGIGIQ